MPRALDPDSFGFLITDIARLMRSETDRRIAEAGAGLTHGEGRALAHAARAGTVRQNVLAERMGIEAMTLSGQLDRLEARGLITRKADPQDRRAKLVSLTEAADTLLQQVRDLAAGLRGDIASEFVPAEWQHFTTMLKTVRDRLLTMRAENQGHIA
jgi:MarR family transcriptional regulator for hemolysin